MSGARSLVQALLASAVDTVAVNPGTSKMHFVAALDQVPGMQCVLGLQECVVTGMVGTVTTASPASRHAPCCIAGRG